MDKEKIKGHLTIALALSSAFFFLSCIGGVTAVIAEMDWLGYLSLAVGLLASLVVVVSTVAAFVFRRWLLGAVGVGSILAGIVVLFIVVVIISLGQYKPPHHDDEDALMVVKDWATVVAEDSLTTELDGKLANGSWWTDGNVFYRMTEQGGKYVFKGGTLHEGGYEFAMVNENDTLRITPMDTLGYFPFGDDGCRVAHYKLEGRMEVLVAFNGYDGLMPIAVLERFDGKEWAYEVGGIYDMLEGTYTVWKTSEEGVKDSVGVWTFKSNGTVQMGADKKAAPYTVEKGFDMPSNIVRLPDGSHVQLLKRSTSVYVNKTVYDADGDCWVATGECLCELERQGEFYSWSDFATRRLLRPSMLRFMNDERSYVRDLFAHLCDDGRPITQLNLNLLNVWCSEEQ
ncbi:MAG: hypothetical protein J6W49_07145 [Paludibacteraceae bacterium]|nr:hypothetical protein [Paludibacteraceae bacterium]